MTLASEKELKSHWESALSEAAGATSRSAESLCRSVTRFVQRGTLLDGALILRWNRAAQESQTAVPIALLMQILAASDRAIDGRPNVDKRQSWILGLIQERLRATLPESDYGLADDEGCLLLAEVMLRRSASRSDWSLLASARIFARPEGRGGRWWLGHDAYELAHDHARRERKDFDLANICMFKKGKHRSERARWRLAVSFARSSYSSWFEES